MDLEPFLARLYTDAALLARFLDDPEGVLATERLTAPERASLQAMDRVGLRLAAESFRWKREGRG